MKVSRKAENLSPVVIRMITSGVCQRSGPRFIQIAKGRVQFVVIDVKAVILNYFMVSVVKIRSNFWKGVRECLSVLLQYLCIDMLQCPDCIFNITLSFNLIL